MKIKIVDGEKKLFEAHLSFVEAICQFIIFVVICFYIALNSNDNLSFGFMYSNR